MARKTIVELEDEIADLKRRLSELRDERDEQSETIQHLREHIEENEEFVEAITGLCLERTEGGWTNGRLVTAYRELHAVLVQLLKEYRRLRRAVAPQPLGRPLAASDEQCAKVLELHKDKRSLRGIAEDTGLGLRTVRTIIERDERRDRSTRKRRRDLGLPDLTHDKVRDTGLKTLAQRANALDKSRAEAKAAARR